MKSLCALSPRRTLITGMASGSIVAFNIDFNRWHYEHQNRYWGGPREEEEAREGGEKNKRERRWSILLCICNTGKQVLRGMKNKYRTLGSIPPVKFTWFEDAAVLMEILPLCTRVRTHTCVNHRHITPWRYTPKPANKIDRLQNGEKSKSSRPCRGRTYPYHSQDWHSCCSWYA